MAGNSFKSNAFFVAIKRRKRFELEDFMRRRMPPFPQAEKEFGLHVM